MMPTPPGRPSAFPAGLARAARALPPAAALALAAATAGAGGLVCHLTIVCGGGETCPPHEADIRVEEDTAGARLLLDVDESYPAVKRTDPESGWVSYVTGLDHLQTHLLTVLPDGAAMVSAQSVWIEDGHTLLYVIGGTGRCQPEG